MLHVAKVVPNGTCSLISGNLVAGKRPVVIFVNGQLSCLIMADEFLMLPTIRLAYAQWTGFAIESVSVGLFGLNILGMERVENVELEQ
jgi:hypothetical protein